MKCTFCQMCMWECDVCKGKRYNRETLEIKHKEKSIADVLSMSVDESVKFFENIPTIRDKLLTLQKVGLGYMSIGQQATTLSGGEAQRIKLGKKSCQKGQREELFIYWTNLLRGCMCMM